MKDWKDNGFSIRIIMLRNIKGIKHIMMEMNRLSKKFWTYLINTRKDKITGLARSNNCEANTTMNYMSNFYIISDTRRLRKRIKSVSLLSMEVITKCRIRNRTSRRVGKGAKGFIKALSSLDSIQRNFKDIISRGIQLNNLISISIRFVEITRFLRNRRK